MRDVFVRKTLLVCGLSLAWTSVATADDVLPHALAAKKKKDTE